MKNGYVSEFTLFMNKFLADHPEVVEDQKRGRDIYWDRKVDLVALKEAQEDSVPDDSYGYYPADWRMEPPP
jgi:Protein of unknown function (DUF3460)